MPVEVGLYAGEARPHEEEVMPSPREVLAMLALRRREAVRALLVELVAEATETPVGHASLRHETLVTDFLGRVLGASIPTGDALKTAAAEGLSALGDWLRPKP